MRLRLGLAVGFGAGYYLGAKAGRERYEQLNSWISRAKESDAYDAATDKAKAVVDLGVERARDLVGDDDEGDNGTATGGAAEGAAVGGPIYEPYPRTP